MRMSGELISRLRCCQPLLLHRPLSWDHARPDGSCGRPPRQAPHGPCRVSAGKDGNSQAQVRPSCIHEDRSCGSRRVDSVKGWRPGRQTVSGHDILKQLKPPWLTGCSCQPPEMNHPGPVSHLPAPLALATLAAELGSGIHHTSSHSPWHSSRAVASPLSAREGLRGDVQGLVEDQAAQDTWQGCQ